MNAGLGSPTARSADRRATVKNEEEKNSDAGAQRLKRKQTAIACVACQKRKSKVRTTLSKKKQSAVTIPVLMQCSVTVDVQHVRSARSA